MQPAALPVNTPLLRPKRRQPRVILGLNDLQSAAKVATRFHLRPPAVSTALASGEPLEPEQGCSDCWHGRPGVGQVSLELAQA